ncbi:unnamed protein product [Knipowitschia caucasica]
MSHTEVLLVSFTSLVLCVQAQLQRSLDSSVTAQPRPLIGRRTRRELPAAMMAALQNGTGPTAEEDSGVQDEEEEVPGAQELVDFSPVYCCLHIYTELVSRPL